MKKLIALVALLALVCTVAVAETVDTYSSASTSKTEIVDMTELAPKLEAQSSLLSTADEVKAEGYTAKEGTTNAQIMGINPDGTPGISTISEWKYTAGEGLGQVTVKLTYGQNAVALADIGSRGTLLVVVDHATTLLHLSTASCEILEYSEETAGQFDQHYSGAAEAKNEYHITFDVIKVEQGFCMF